MSEPQTEAGPGSRRFRDLLARERHDMGWLVHNVAAMYDEISGGRISKPNTYPEEVIRAFEERLNDAADEAAAEARTEALDDALAALRLVASEDVYSTGVVRLLTLEQALAAIAALRRPGGTDAS